MGSHAEFGDAKKRQDQYNAAILGGAKGAGLGLSVALPTAYILHQRWLPFRHLTLPLKAFFVTSGTIVAGIISADKAGIAFEREHFSDQGAKNIAKHHSLEEKQWSELSTRDKSITWVKDNKFSVVAGSWIASMGGVFAYIHSQPMSFPQKLVQTRVWAQGLTVATLLGMAAITQIPSAGDKILKQRERAADHSWQDFIGDSNTDPSVKEKANASAGGGGGGSSGNSSSSSSSSGGGGDSSADATSGDSNKNSMGKSSAGNIGSATSSKHAQKASESSSTNTDSSGKSSRSAHPNSKEKSQPTKAPASQTGTNAGYSGNN